MKKLLLGLICLLITCFGYSQTGLINQSQERALKGLDAQFASYHDMAHEIWNLAELGFMEEESVKILSEKLEAAEFTIEHGVADMPTAFIATYGSGQPVIGLLAEYDALPGMSQKPTTTFEPLVDGGAGHACGHHLFGTGSVAAAISIKEWLQASGESGTIRLYGTPAEEGGGGKIFMVRTGLFDDVDAVLSWHPSDTNRCNATSSLAAASMNFKFRGVASHAAAAPERGRSALDGVEAMNHMVNLMREHIPQDSRIHYSIKYGGGAANIVPATAEVSYIIRHPDIATMKNLIERVERAAQGAALGTDTKVEKEVEIGYYNILSNETLSETMHENLSKVGGVIYDQQERVFATEIMTSYDPKDKTLASAGEVQEYTTVLKRPTGSTDVGDISWVVPTANLSAATWVPGTSAHSWQAVAAGGTTIGTKGMMVAAKTMTSTAITLYENPSIIAKAKEELLEKRGADFKYECLVGDNPPPLNYRK